MMGASSVAFLVFLLCLCSVKVESQRSFYKIPYPAIEVFWPSGLRVSISDENGIQLFTFHGVVNRHLNGLDADDLNKDILEKKNGRWVFENRTLRLNIGDVLDYRLHVNKDNLLYRLLNQSFTVTEDPKTLAHPVEEYASNSPSINFQYPPLPSLKEAQCVCPEHLIETVPLSHNYLSRNQPSTTEQPLLATTPFFLPETRNVLQELLVNCSRENEHLLNRLMELQEDKTYLENTLNSIDDINLHKLILSGGNENTDSAIMQVETILREKLGIDNFNIVRAAVINENGSITFELNSLDNKLHVLRVAKEKLANSQLTIEDTLQTNNLEIQHRYKRATKIGGSSSTRSISRPKSTSARSRSRLSNIGRSSSTRSGNNNKRNSKPTPPSKSTRFNKIANTVNTGLKPLGKVTNVLSASSNTAANIFNIIHSSWLTASHVKANEASIRVNNMNNELSKFKVNEAKEKKAYINTKTGELQTKISGLNRDIGYLKTEIKELKGKEETDIIEDRINRKQIDINEKQQEISLLEKEIEYYKLIEI